MILDRPNHFCRVPIILERSNSFCLGPNYFGLVQIMKISPEKSNLNLNKMFWTPPKHCTRPKQFWTAKTYFEPIEGKVMNFLEL